MSKGKKDKSYNIDPLDLILFKPNANIISNIIGKVQQVTLGNGEWTHVGIAINRFVLPDCGDIGRADDMFIWESTVNERKIGVQLNNLRTIYTSNDYDGKIAVAKLDHNPAARRKDEEDFEYFKRLAPVRKVVNTLYNKTIGTGYSCNPFVLLAAAFKWLRPVRQCIFKSPKLRKISGKEWIFCSELAVMLYHDLGIIDKKVKAKDTVPMDFLGFDQDGMKRHFKDPIVFYGVIEEKSKELDEPEKKDEIEIKLDEELKLPEE